MLDTTLEADTVVMMDKMLMEGMAVMMDIMQAVKVQQASSTVIRSSSEVQSKLLSNYPNQRARIKDDYFMQNYITF